MKKRPNRRSSRRKRHSDNNFRPSGEILEIRQMLAADAATWLEPSAFLIGDVAMKVVGFESDGSIDPNVSTLDQEFRNDVKQAIGEATDWLVEAMAIRSDRHELNFVIDYSHFDNPVQTGYEPSQLGARSRSAVFSSMTQDFLAEVGHTDEDSTYRNSARYLDGLRDELSTDWAFILYVTRDAFPGYSGGFAALSGPYAATLSGSATSPPVIAHEILHVFGALDEYPGGTTYGREWGYLGVACTDCANGHPNPEEIPVGIMSNLGAAWPIHAMTPSTLAHIGWRDSNSDGLFDILDVPLNLEGSGETVVTQGETRFQFSGSANAVAYPNQFPAKYTSDITVNTIDVLEYRLDNSQWITAATYSDRNSTDVALNILTGDAETIEIRARDLNTEITSNVMSFEVQQDGAIIAPQVSVTNLTSNSATLEWTDAGPETGYLVFRYSHVGEFVDANTLRFELQNLEPSTVYRYGVMAYVVVDGVYVQRQYGNVEFTTPDGQPPQEDPRVQYEVKITNLEGDEVTEVQEATPFQVQVWVDDLREDGDGVFSAFVDVLANSGVSIREDSIRFGESLDTITAFDLNASDALLGDAGGMGDAEAPGGAAQLLMSFEATAEIGMESIQFDLDLAGQAPLTDTLVFGHVEPLTGSQVEFVGAQVVVSALNPFDLSGDDRISPLDALMVVEHLRDGTREYDRQVDVNRDGRIDVQDAFLVIDAVREAFAELYGAGSEGEAARRMAAPAPTIEEEEDVLPWQLRHDRVFTLYDDLDE